MCRVDETGIPIKRFLANRILCKTFVTAISQGGGVVWAREGNMDKLASILEKAGNTSRRIDWPTIAAVVTIVVMIGLMVAVIFRRQFRARLYDRTPSDYYMSKHLPVPYLSDDGKERDIWVTPSEFVSYGGLYNIAKGMKHGMCTDDAGWTQFCLFAAAKAYVTMRNSDGDDGRYVEEVVADSIEKTSMPYLRFLYGKIGGADAKGMSEELVRVAFQTSEANNFRGVKGRTLLGLTDIVSVVSAV